MIDTISGFSILKYFPCLLWVLIILFGPGLLFNEKLKSHAFARLERLAIIPFFSVVMTALGMPILIKILPYPSFAYTLFVLLLLFLSLKTRARALMDFLSNEETRFLLFAYLFLIIFCLSFVSLPIKQPYDWGYITYSKVQVMSGGLPVDNSIPYRFAQFYLNKLDFLKNNFFGVWEVSDRTPLMGIFSSFVFATLRVVPPTEQFPGMPGLHSFNIFQVTGTALNALFLFSFYLLVKQIFNKRLAKVCTVISLFTPFLLINTFFTWPKMMATYFIFLSYYFVIKKRVVLSAVFAAIAYLCHNLSIFYLAGMVFYWILDNFKKNKIVFKPILRGCLKMLLVIFVVLLPWFWWTSMVLRKNSQFFLYPFAIHGLEDGVKLEAAGVFRDLKTVSFINVIGVRVSHFFQSVVPYELFNYFFNLNPDNEIFVFKIPFLVYHANTFSLASTAGLSFFFFFWVSTVGNFKKYWKEVLSFILIPFLGIAFSMGWPRGINSIVSMHPIVPLVVTFSQVYIYDKPKNNWVYWVFVAEYVFVFWGFLFFRIANFNGFDFWAYFHFVTTFLVQLFLFVWVRKILYEKNN